MSAVIQANPENVLMNAFNNACLALSVSRDDKSEILGVNVASLSRKTKNKTGFPPTSKTGELQLNFIRIYRSLYAIAGGDNEFMQHWYQTHNKALNGAPSVLCKSIQGLISVNQYLDAMRGKI
jgi:hypothetical protein